MHTNSYAEVPATRHPLGNRARILLSSVFGPYAQDDAYGSRVNNPMELYHNQVTREQGVFSLRMHHRSFGIMLLQANVSAPCALLDFPSEKQFVDELCAHPYDIVGITGIIPNIHKVARMCQLVRRHRPGAQILIGGHVANTPKIETLVDADHIVKGEGVRWLRAFVGDDVDAPIRHPLAYAAHDTRAFGFAMPDKPGDTAAILLPSVGCPVGCNFCSTSAMFGGKGKSFSFYETGDELFDIMVQLEEKLSANSFFALDENFLLNRKRSLRLLELMQTHNKPWALYVFSSARVLRSYTMEQLVGLGVSWVWMGLEGEDSQYRKLSGVDTRSLVRDLRANGIRVLGSTIIGLENHTPECMDSVIEFAASHNSDFHQFMLYTPIPGTPLYEEHREAGTLLSEEECPLPDTHGQTRFNFRHPHITGGYETDCLRRAFTRDFEVNGPSLVRMIETTLMGWRTHKNHPDARVRARFEREAKPLATVHAAAVWAARRWYRKNSPIRMKLDRLFDELGREFGLKTRVIAPVLGRVMQMMMRREVSKLKSGWTHEPAFVREVNGSASLSEASERGRASAEISWVVAQAASNFAPQEAHPHSVFSS